MDIPQSDQMEQTMKSTKEAIDRADIGQLKQSALKHYQSAQKAQSANKQHECLKECDAAMNRLSA